MASTNVNVKMGVTGVSELKRSMTEAKNAIKTLDSALELNEKQYRKTGDAEEYMKQKADLLQTKLEKQKTVVDNAKKALEQMSKDGTDKASASFQKMQQTLLKAESDLLDTETQLKGIKTGSTEASTGVDSMNESLKQIGKGVSFQNLTTGLKDITDKLESAARTAIRLGRNITNSMKESTGWADDLMTRSAQYGIDEETLQKMDHVAELIDTDVDTIVTAKDKLAKNRDKITDLFGIETEGKSADQLFWEVGEAIQNMTDEMDKSEAAQKVFGKSWRELAPLFKAGKEEYDALMDRQNVLTSEQVKQLAEADDKIKEIEQNIQQMKNEFWANNSDKIIGLAQWVIDNSESVKTGLIAIGAGYGALKLAETAADLRKVVNAFKNLTSLGSAASAAGTAAGAGFGASFVNAFVAAAPALASMLGIAGVATAGAFYAQAEVEKLAEEKRAERLESAEKLQGTERQFLERSANALGTYRDPNGEKYRNVLGQGWIGGNEAEIIDLLMGMKDRSGIEMAKMSNMLLGTYTSQGNDTWYELQRLWGGEEMDMGRMRSILESIADAYDRMAKLEEETNAVNEKNAKNSLTSSDLSEFKGMPAAVARAVEKATIVVNVDADNFGRKLAPVVGGYQGVNVLRN